MSKFQPANETLTTSATREQLNYGRRVIDFLRFGKPAFAVSMVLVVLSVVIVFTKGFNLGLDFTGGTSVEITVNKNVELDQVRDAFESAGYHQPVVQYYGSSHDIMIRLPPLTGEQNDKLGSKLSDLMHHEIDSNATVKRVEFIGPTVGAELAQDGILAVLACLVCILIYIGFRFEWRFGAGAVIALAHDVLITLGYLSFFQKELDLTIIAALLSVIGYSLNDTIVVFDRIRENFRKIRRASSYDVMDISLTQTLHRTLMTSLTTLAVVICLYVWGGPMLRGFSETLIVGIFLGTLSSIYVAAYLAYIMGAKRTHFIVAKVEVEGADQDRIAY